MNSDKQNNADEFVFGGSDNSNIPSDEVNTSLREHHSSHRHRSHHHHSHHSSHKHSSKSKNKSQFISKLKKYLKNNKYVFRSLIVAVIAVVVLAGAAVIVTELNRNSYGEAKSDTLSGSIVKLSVSSFDKPVLLVPEIAEKYLESDSSVSLLDMIIDSDITERIDIGVPVTLSYDIRISSDEAFIVSASAEIWKDGAIDSPHIFKEFEGTRNSLNIYNLIPDCSYTFTVTVTLSDGSSASASGKLKTAPSPRFLNIDGVVNLRDIGGWETVEGKRIKYGVLYRGSELDGRIERDYLVSSAGVAEMTGYLGIKRDFDLREANRDMSYSSPLGPSVRRIFYNSQMYVNILTPEGRITLKNLFTDLAKPDNYPAYIHCTYGLDRTGTVCFILEALLGVPEEALLKDYELSTLYHRSNVFRANINSFMSEFKMIEGASLKD